MSMRTLLCVAVLGTAWTDAQSAGTDFRVANQTHVASGIDNPFSANSALSHNALLLVWTESTTTKFAVYSRSSLERLSEGGTIGICAAPQAAFLAGTDVFLVGCLREDGVLIALIAGGKVESKSTVKAERPSDLRLQSLSSAQIACTFSAPDGDSSGVFLLLLDRNGAAASPSRVNVFVQGSQRRALVAETVSGFTVQWESLRPDLGIIRQLFSPSGKRIGAEETVANCSEYKLMNAISAGQREILIVSRENWGDGQVLVTDVNDKTATFTAVSGLPKPIWRVREAHLAAASGEKLLLGLSYTSASGQTHALLLSLAPSGCHFAVYSFPQRLGDTRITSLSIDDSTLSVVSVDSLTGGFTLSFFAVPAASVCFAEGIAREWPGWMEKQTPNRGLPEVAIAVAAIAAAFLLGTAVAACCWRECAKVEEERRRKNAAGLSEQSFSKASIVIEEEKLS